MKSIDRTIVNIVSILVGGGGIFAIFTEYQVPELHLAFLDGNPFSQKREIIANAQGLVFTALTLSALVIQLWVQVAGNQLDQRRHELATYLAISVCGLVVLALGVWALSQFGQWWARSEWQPIAIESQREAFERATFVVSHDGWSPEHLAQRDAVVSEGNAERYTRGNLDSAVRDLGYIERLLEVESSGTPAERIVRLRTFFDK